MVSQSVAVWILIALAVAAANLPFISERVLALMPIKTWVKKPAWALIVEFLGLFVVIGLVGYAFETALVNPFPRAGNFMSLRFASSWC